MHAVAMGTQYLWMQVDGWLVLIVTWIPEAILVSQEKLADLS